MQALAYGSVLLVQKLDGNAQIRLDLACFGLLGIHQIKKFLAVLRKALERGARVGSRTDEPTDQSLRSNGLAALGLRLQILDAQNFHAVDHACRDLPDLTGIAEP